MAAQRVVGVITMPTETKFADPEPIGLMGFALTTFIIGLIEAKWLVASGSDSALLLAILYGGIVQAIAGILAWRDGNTLAMAAFLTYGAFNIWYGLFELFSINGVITPTSDLTAFGVVVLGFGIITVLWFIGTLEDSLALAAVFATLALTYILVGVGYWLDFGALNIWGGYFAMASALIAAYTAFAHVTNQTFGHDIVPMGPSLVNVDSDDGQAGAGQAGD